MCGWAEHLHLLNASLNTCKHQLITHSSVSPCALLATAHPPQARQTACSAPPPRPSMRRRASLHASIKKTLDLMMRGLQTIAHHLIHACAAKALCVTALTTLYLQAGARMAATKESFECMHSAPSGTQNVLSPSLVGACAWLCPQTQTL